MTLAIWQNGQIRPLEALPKNWQEGQRLRVEIADEGEATVEEIDRDFALLASLCADSDPADEERLVQALETQRQQAKTQVRRQMGLS